MGQWVFLNGKYVDYDQALIHVEDRGNTFADGVYEVIRYYRGKGFKLNAHLARLENGCRTIKLPLPYSLQELAEIADETVRRNGLQEARLYMQITRGPAPRAHYFPQNPDPTIFMIARNCTTLPEEVYEKGVICRSVEDIRWSMCNVKAIGLLANVLAKQQIHESGAFEGIFVRNGIVTEGTSSNAFAVINGIIYTHPKGPFILPGVTRDVVIELAKRLRFEVKEEPITISQLKEAEEVFVTGSTVEVVPVINLDSNIIGDGKPGSVTKKLIKAFREYMISY
jgi:D-alanine transaminase